MADTDTGVRKHKWLITALVVVGVVVAAALVVRFFVYEEEQSQAELSDQAIAQLAFLNQLGQELNPLLSEEGQASLQVIGIYINNNPYVLDEENPEFPAVVVAAAKKVRQELQSAIGTINDTENGGSDVTTNAPAGEMRTITGTLEVSDTDSPYGTTYQITDNDSGMTYYFIFGDSTNQMIEDDGLVGQEVSVEIEMTGEGQSFTVVSGPTLVE